MISDFKTNTIYFSEILQSKYSDTCNQITEVLGLHDITPIFLPNTKDIWARDYMPIQVSDSKFVRYDYNPDYLKPKTYQKLKTEPNIICKSIGLKTIKTNLILDGGNVIKSSNHVIMTDKVIIENRETYAKEKLLAVLQNLFEVDHVVLIPWDKEEPYGHADGMVRFINDETVLIQDYYNDYGARFKDNFFGALDKVGLSFFEMKFDGETVDENSWSYMNFLQTKDIILLPSYGIPEDNQALEQIKKYYPDYAQNKIAQIDWNEMISGGGGLNCISWTVLS